MKISICFRLFSLVCLLMLSTCSANEYPNGCIYANGRCVEACEDGTHPYTADCNSVTKEATCTEPNPVQDTSGIVCGYSACYCDPPTVRDEMTGKCVELKDCTIA